MNKLLTSRHGPWVTGGILGLLAVLLVKLGNPGNMGFCVACFTRDIAGALGLLPPYPPPRSTLPWTASAQAAASLPSVCRLNLWTCPSRV